MGKSGYSNYKSGFSSHRLERERIRGGGVRARAGHRRVKGDTIVNVDQLRAFVEVAERGSFAKAADSLYITRNGLSYQIKQMEGELGFCLFERDTRHVRLTAEGTSLLPTARQMLQLWDNTMDSISCGRQPQQTLNIGMVDFMDRNRVSTADRLFRLRCPGARILPTRVPLFNPSFSMQGIVQGRIDAAFITDHEIGSMRSFEFVPFCHAFFGALVPIGHRLAQQGNLAWSDLDNEDIVLTEGLRHPENRVRFDDTEELLNSHFPHARLVFVADLAAVFYMVEHNGCIGVVVYSDDAWAANLSGMALHRTGDDVLKFGLAMPLSIEERSPLVQPYIDACREAYADAAGSDLA